MDKRQAKKIICAFLAMQLDPSIIDEYIVAEAEGDSANLIRLTEALEELEQEMMRRSEGVKPPPTSTIA